jgi:hypothetical protein
MTKPQFTLIPSAYNTSKVYSVLPVNGDGDFDFDRASKGTRVREDGLIEEVTNNIPRLDWYDSNCPSLLLEPQRTNYASNSGDASQWATVSGSQSVTKTQNYAISPNGTRTAARIQANATGSNYSLIQLSTSSFIGNYAGSVYLKSNTGNTENVIVYGRNTSITSYPIGNEWQRIEIQGSGTSGENLYLFLGSFPNNGSDENVDILVWGGQLEQGTYTSSYIPTPSITTRLKDECLNGGDSDLFDITEGSFFVDVLPYNAGLVSTISLSNNSTSQRILIQFQSNGTQVRLFSSGGVSNYQTITFNQRNKILVTFKLNEYKFYINGALVSTDTSATVPTGLDRVNFSNSTANSDFFQGEVNDTRVYDRVLTEAEAIKLTT